MTSNAAANITGAPGGLAHSTQEIIMAGFGGQGILAMGQLLAYAGMLEEKHVSWLPSYGAEMRGGTANCTVVISDEPIASPISSRPSVVVAMNGPSLDRFESTLRPGGLLLVNTSLAGRKARRNDVRVLEVEATGIADELGEARVANMVMLGALVAVTGVVGPESVMGSLAKVLPARRHSLIPLNEQALARGREAAAGGF
jgi:2-oxoglutarate ferredoxin oxidoreductase subunit gamma